MKVKINGRELRVVKSTKVLVEWQHQSGKSMAWLAEPEGQVYSLAFMAFCALQNAGYEPKWDELLDIDTEEWVFTKEPTDNRGAVDALEQPSSPEGSEAADAGGANKHAAKPGSKHSSKPKGGSKSK
jgi:hypothetical protein